MWIVLQSGTTNIYLLIALSVMFWLLLKEPKNPWNETHSASQQYSAYCGAVYRSAGICSIPELKVSGQWHIDVSLCLKICAFIHEVLSYASLSNEISCTVLHHKQKRDVLEISALPQGLWNDQIGWQSCFQHIHKACHNSTCDYRWVKLHRARKWSKLPWCKTDVVWKMGNK